jgi:hypothetical protein
MIARSKDGDKSGGLRPLRVVDAGRKGSIGQINYSAAKAGMLAMAMTTAREWARYNIRANAICFGVWRRRLTEVVRGEKFKDGDAGADSDESLVNPGGGGQDRVLPALGCLFLHHRSVSRRGMAVSTSASEARGSHTMLDYHKTRAFDSVVRQTYAARDTILYALGLGFGADPLDPSQIRFVYERELQAMPTIAAVLASPGFWMRDRKELGIDAMKVVHGEQMLQVHAPLPTEGTVVGRTQVTRVVDKGAGQGRDHSCRKATEPRSDSATVGHSGKRVLLSW